ncbi:MAG: N-acetylglucosamine-6-phosphate deacetylase [Bryobacteraceae bacterium]
MRLERNVAGVGLVRLEIGDGLIRSVDVSGAEEPHRGYIAPGLIDIHINGFAGVDFSDPCLEPEQAASVVEPLRSTGVVAFCPTLVTNSMENLSRNLRVLQAARTAYGHFAAAVPCFHLEGPWLSAGKARGIHDPGWMRPPVWDDFVRLQEAAGGNIGLVTLAPELPGAVAFIARLRSAGVLAALGHTEAAPECIHEAAAAGATLATHLGNGCPQLLDRHQNPLWAQMNDDRLSASLICDGFHLPRDVVQTIVRAKGIRRCLLITDATHVATLPPGRYRLAGTDIELLPSGKVIKADGACLGGSALSMDRAVTGFMALSGASLADGLRAASETPAHFLGRRGLCRGLKPGEPANLFCFELQAAILKVKEVYVGGAGS